jgi:hypothetical protein
MDALNWRKASYSASNGGCVEVAGPSDRVLVRDTQDRDGPVLRFGPAAWRDFADRVKRFLARRWCLGRRLTRDSPQPPLHTGPLEPLARAGPA